jgi:hypothetical protein
MEPVSFMNWIPFNNMLYIGDEAKVCISIMERFNDRLREIELNWSGWLDAEGRLSTKLADRNKLQHHIQYHFEGGIAIFKFRDPDELPAIIKNECIAACRSLAIEHYFNAC